MNRFEFKGRIKTILYIGMIVGIISLAIQYFVVADELNSQFWSDVLLNNTFFLGLSLMALFALSAFITAWAGWYTVFRRLLEAFNIFIAWCYYNASDRNRKLPWMASSLPVV